MKKESIFNNRENEKEKKRKLSATFRNKKPMGT